MSSDSETTIDMDESIRGHHEEIRLTDSEDEKKDIVPNHKETYKHLMWHCMVYRKALGKVESGYEVLNATLQEARNEIPCCVGCEEDETNQRIKDLGHEEMSVNGETAAGLTEWGCSNCAIDAKKICLEKLKQQRSGSPIFCIKKSNRRRISM